MLRVLSRVEVAERMTSRDFFRCSPEDQKAELIDGVMNAAPPPLSVHERLQVFLLRLLSEYVEIHQLGEVLGSRSAVALADDQAFEPDILFVSGERSGIIRAEGVFGAPDLVVEILPASTATYDRGAKFRAYERAGVGELWLIDPYGPAGTEFYQLQGAVFNPIMPGEKGPFSSGVLPGFKLDTNWLWPAVKFIPVRKALQAMGVS
jgi:Uma2 family endonuclease